MARRRVECDLLCVGGGLGGLAAAVRGHDLGLDVLVLEASSMVGGGVSYGAGLAWIPCTHLAQAAGISDTLESANRYLDSFSQNDDVMLRRAWLDSGPGAIRWYAEQAGLPFELAHVPDDEADAPDGLHAGRFVTMSVAGGTLGEWQARTRVGPLFPRGVTMAELHAHSGRPHDLAQLVSERTADDRRTFGAGVAAGFARAALTERSVRVELGARVVSLEQRDGEIVGAIAVVGDEEIEVRAARGVLIAAGSYGNAEYAAVFERLPDLVELGPPLAHGDNLSLADPTAAALSIGSPASILPAMHIPGDTHPGTDIPLYRPTTNLSWQHAILVNRQGARFGDEMFHGPELAAHVDVDPVTGDWRNFPSFLVCDDRMRRNYPLHPLPAGADWPDGLAVRAENLRELADLAGIDPDGLSATVERFNGFVAAGVDQDFGRGRLAMGRGFGDSDQGNPNLAEISEPPFWAIDIRLAGGGNYSLGIAIDGNGQAVTRSGEPVPGLYATGNSAVRAEVMRHHTGVTDSCNIVWAFNAATHAAGAV
jgi:3-oxosteroid 1-dehydrogenase